MNRRTIEALVLAAPLALAVSCSGKAVQPISGKLALDTFRGSVTSVRASRPGAGAIVVPIAGDGAFALSLPAGRQYRLEFLGPDGVPRLVFPRKAGSLQWRFDVRGPGQTFDLGVVRYVGDPKNMTVAFTRAQTLQAPDASAPANADVDCEDGHDKKTGAVCVDDDHDHQDGCLDGKDDGQANDAECVDGKDSKTGQPCTDDEGATPPATAAVADHNLPAAIGSCQEQDNGENNDKGGHGKSED